MKVKIKSNKNILKFLLRGKVTPEAQKILSMLGHNHTNTEIAEKLSFSKQRVYYWIKKFLEYHMIKEHLTGKPKYYRLTPIGQKFLTGSEEGQKLCILEDYPMKFRLIKDYGMLDWEKLGDPRNWVKMGVRIGDVTVVKTSKSIIIHTGQLSGSHDAVLMEAGAIRSSVQSILETNGVVMEYIPEPLHDAQFKFYTKAAELLHNEFGNMTVKNIRLDNSPPPKAFSDKIQRQPHIEGDRKFAVDYMLQSTNIAEIRQEMDELKETLRGVVDGIKDVSHGLEYLGNNNVELTKAVTQLSSNINTLLTNLSGVAQNKEGDIPVPNNSVNPFVR